MKNRIDLTFAQKVERLSNTFNKLGELCILYDEGKVHFYKEIATNIRILFHNVGRSKALVGQLLDLKSVTLLSTGQVYDPENLAPHTPLISLQFRKGEHPIYVHNKPPFDYERKLLFERWWNGEWVYVDISGIKFTRSDIVLDIANTDGGAHYDTALPENYYLVSHQNNLGWTYYSGASDESMKGISMGNPLISTLRTIAEEVLISMNPMNQQILLNMDLTL